MALADFLKQPHTGSASKETPSTEIAAWQAAVTGLIERFTAVLSKYEQLVLHRWSVLREHHGVRYNADALSIEFGEEAVITVEPEVIAPVANVLGRASLNCGVRQLHLDCDASGKVWRYQWVIPHDGNSAELTSETIETIVEELLKSSLPTG